MDQETATPSNKKRLFGAIAVSLLPLGALIFWGLAALNEESRAKPANKKTARRKAPEQTIGPRRVNLSGNAKPPPLPVTTTFATDGNFYLSDMLEPPRFVTESFWEFRARASQKPVTVTAQSKKTVFKDGVIRCRLVNLPEGKQSHEIAVSDSRKRVIRGVVSFIVDSKAPTLVLFGMSSGAVSVKLGDSIQGQVQDAYLKSLTLNGESWTYDVKGLFTYTPDRIGEQVVILRATDAAAQSRELKVVVKVAEPDEVAAKKIDKSIESFGPAVFSDDGRRKWKYFGAASCGGASCHGATKPLQERPGDEYTTWQKKDPHAKSFNTLFNEASTEMCEELDIEDASKDKKCTVCHSTDVPKELQGDKYNVEDGVSCDGCHGPAEGWYKPHTKPHKYKDMLKLGMWDTRNAYRRGDVCIKCHSQIDSELIDAGHPSLNFELFSATQRQPPHYRERNTWDPVRLWSVGLLLGAREDTVALEKELKAKKDEENKIRLGDSLKDRLEILQYFPSKLRRFRSAPFVKYDRSLKRNDEFRNLKGKHIKNWAKQFDSYARKLGSEGPRDRYFDRTRLKILAEILLKDAAVDEVPSEFQAASYGGAFWALYNSYYFGEKPRLNQSLMKKDIFGQLELRPGVFKPDSLFDDEDQFDLKTWQSRLRPLKGLFESAPQRRSR